ncbi:MAG: hypothetical protein AAGA53_17785, partial [Pseudomonadota bacterium]
WNSKAFLLPDQLTTVIVNPDSKKKPYKNFAKIFNDKFLSSHFIALLQLLDRFDGSPLNRAPLLIRTSEYHVKPANTWAGKEFQCIQY